MFIPSPVQVKAMVIGLGAMAIVCLSLLVFGLYWRGEYREVKAELGVAIAQGAVLADKIGTCSAATDETKRVGDAAIAEMRVLAKQARDAGKGNQASAAALEELARQARKTGEGCDWAWKQIEEQKRKARATP